MQAWQATTLSPDLRIDVVERPARPDAAALREVDRLWDEARRANPALFNGRVFSADHVAAGCIVGHWTEYRFGYAQIRRPSLYDALGVRPVAVNGVVRCPEGIVFGRRDANAVYQAGLWQCPPAGSIESRAGADRVDLAAQLAFELEEELGLAGTEIRSLRPLSAVEHPGSHVLDIGVSVETGVAAADIVARQRRARGCAEYDEIVVVPVDQVGRRIDEWAESLVPPARFFLALVLEGSSR